MIRLRALGWVQGWVHLVFPPILHPPQYETRGKEQQGQKVMKMKVSERTIETSGRIVLECSGCGELVFLLGHEGDWSSEHRNAFECSGCGKRLTLADRGGRKPYRIRTLLRRSIRPFNLGT
jgi:hypothetical protein